MDNKHEYLDGMTLAARELFDKEAVAMEAYKAEILERVANLAEGKTVYDEHFPWWTKHIFGDASFAHELVKKALRAASLVAAGFAGKVEPTKFVDSLEDCLYDALNFIIMWLAWRKYRASEQSNIVEEDINAGLGRTLASTLSGFLEEDMR
jgi:hypothetical protein